MSNKLIANDALTKLVTSKGIKSWTKLLEYVRLLPYGRNSSRTDFKLVITEQKGSCSSKHAFLKRIADLNEIPNIELILGMYKMDKHNTPGIRNAFDNTSIDYIPEAHCYLKIAGERIDVTSSDSQIDKLDGDILQEIKIKPEQVAEFKVEYHKNYLRAWIKENKVEKTFEEIWLIREQCIKNLIQ